MLEETVTIEIFQYSPLGKELKAQTNIAKKQSHKSDNTKSILNKYSKSDVIYKGNNSFYKYFCYNKKFDNLSFKSKHSFLVECVWESCRIIQRFARNLFRWMQWIIRRLNKKIEPRYGSSSLFIETYN